MTDIDFETFFEGWQEDQDALVWARSEEERRAISINIEGSAHWFRTHFDEYLDSAVRARCLKDFELLLRVYPQLDAEGWCGDTDYFSEDEAETGVPYGYENELFCVEIVEDKFEPWCENDYLLPDELSTNV